MEDFPYDPGSTASVEACARIRDHLAHGAPWDACDAFRSAIAAHPADPELLFCGALAHARAGATREAHALLDRAQARTPSRWLTVEIVSLRGRLWKDRLHRHPDAPDAASIAQRARDEYLAAYALQKDPYPGINAATLSMILGDRADARRLATEIADGLAKQATMRTCWDYATAGEAAASARASRAGATKLCRRRRACDGRHGQHRDDAATGGPARPCHSGSGRSPRRCFPQPTSSRSPAT